MSSVRVHGHTKSWDPHVHDQQFGMNESIGFGMSQRLQKEGNDRINKVSAMRPGLAKIIEKVHISTNVESPETDLHIAENTWCINYTENGLVLPMAPDGCVRSGSRSKPNHCQIVSWCCKNTRTVNLCTVQRISPNPSESDWLSASRPAGPSVDSYYALVFAVW